MRGEAEIDWDGLTEIVVRSAREALAAGPLTLAELTAVLRRNGVFDSVVRDDPAGDPGSTERNEAYFAVPAAGWEAARALLDAEFTADGPGWIQFVELDGILLVRAGLRPEGEELVVSTSSLRRLGDIRNLLEPAGFRHLRTDLTEPDDEFTDDDQYDGDWDDDDDVEFSAIDAMFEPAPGRGPSVTDAVLAARDDERD